MAKSPATVTELLHAWSDGDKAALDQLVPVVYDELRPLTRGTLVSDAVMISQK